MTEQQIEAQARAFAQQTQWDGNAAIIFIRELLTDINMHTVCRRFDEILEEEDKRLAEAEQLFLAQWNNAA